MIDHSPQPTIIRTIARNVISSWGAVAVQVVLVFFLTPFVLKSLGATRYGLWALVTGLTGYYGLLDFGFRAGMTQYLTRHLATKNFAKMNATASAGFVALVGCGWLVAMATLVTGWLAPSVFSIPPDLISETRWCVLVIGLGIAITFALQPFAAVFPAVQRFEITNAVVIGSRLLSAAATLVAIWLGYGLIVLSFIVALSDLLLYATLWRVAYRVLPELRISPRLATRDDFRQIVSFGGWSFLINGASILKSRADIVLIGLLLPIEAIAPYALALSMVEYFDRIFVPIGYVFFPALTELDARGDKARLKKAYLSGTKLLMLLSIAVGTLSALWAGDFFRLWITTDITNGGRYPSPATLYCILVVGAAAAASQCIGRQVCAGTRTLKPLAAIVVCEITLNIGLSILLVHRFGLIGIALGTLVTAVVFQALVLPTQVLQILGIPGRDYVRNTWTPVFLTILGGTCLLAPFMYAIPHIASWPRLLLFAALSGIATAIPILLIGLSYSERQRFLRDPLISLSHAIKKPSLGQDTH